ncbi:MAG TPA: aminopeptidase [Candidatus Kapabacteria bacterium]|nr:aminopeptidase [Candidatus Kapabacteria bacterium]
MASLKLKRAINVLIKDYLCLNEDESILIISDSKKQEVGLHILELTRKITKDAFYMEINTAVELDELPNIIYEASKAVDTMLVVADIPMFHSNMLKDISNLGIRVAILPPISEDGLNRCLQVDIDELNNNVQKYEELLKNTSIVRIESKTGVDISLPIKGREVFSVTGILKKIGETGIIPSTKVFVSPIDAKTNGTLVIDGYIEQIGILKNTVSIQIENGIATKISGDGDDAKYLAKILNKYGEEARNLSEFGLGINPRALVSNDFYETESALTTCFVAFGNNRRLGGNTDIPIRLSCIIEKPTILFDDEVFMSNGKILK